MLNDLFHPLVQQWFEGRFQQPTEAQSRGWPSIAAGRSTLISAPTGSGKTLSAFLVCLDRLFRLWCKDQLEDQIYVVYVSPLKALSNDIHRNLEIPLSELNDLAQAAGQGPVPIRAKVRTGDTPASERQAMLRRPPHILVTTPESLYLLLTSEKARQILRNVETVIIDEIHALARDKRGSHLSLTLERLDELCREKPVRVGLSATQKPIKEIANFLIGANRTTKNGKPNCNIIDAGHIRELDLSVEAPPTELSAVCSHEHWDEVYSRLTELIHKHRSTLVFVNTRRMAERVAHHLTETLGEEHVASHHGSLSRKLRLAAEKRLKEGELKVIIATASLEMGIDVGLIDLVCQIGSPRSISTFIQRVGRSGHSLGKVPQGRLFPLTRDELLECLALVRSVREGVLDRIEIPVAPLDILAQQIVAEVASQDCEEDQLFYLCRQAWPYRDLPREDFDSIIKMLNLGIAPGVRHGAYLHRDAIAGKLRARRSARLTALTSGGAIPETALYKVITAESRTFVGTVDEDFAIESMAGDVFLLGNSSWRIRRITNGEVIVSDAEGAPPNIPFWVGEAPGRTIELSEEISRLRRDIACRCAEGMGDDSNRQNVQPSTSSSGAIENIDRNIIVWLEEICSASHWAAEQAVRYVAAQQAALGIVPTCREIVFERFFDESGTMQLVIHAPLGARVNRAWGLALRKRFCRSFDFELQASADDNGIVLSLGPQHSFPIESLFQMLTPQNGQSLLEQALLAVPMFQVRWRWNVTRALVVLRQQAGRKVPPYLQRFRSDDLLAAVFPDQVGCLENHSEDIAFPDHPLIRQTVKDCFTEAMDVYRWLSTLNDIQSSRIQLIARDTHEPSPFAHELINANPYAFLDGAPLEERRTRAVATRRTLSVSELKDLGSLDPQAIEQVRNEAWPLVRDTEELHDALLSFVTIEEEMAESWTSWFEELITLGRAVRITRPNLPTLWIAAENLPIMKSVLTDIEITPSLKLPESLDQNIDRSKALVELVRGMMLHNGPINSEKISRVSGLDTDHVFSALEALEGEGVVLRGHFTSGSHSDARQKIEWCDRRLLARIHRLTLSGLRRKIQPVKPTVFWRFLTRHHRLTRKFRNSGHQAVRDVIAQFQGFETPSAAWENQILLCRLDDYDPQWLDHYFMTGEFVWGRLCPPARRPEENSSTTSMTRAVPISLLIREDLPWLLTSNPQRAPSSLRPNAQAVWESLSMRGALFGQELLTLAKLLPAHLEEALRELATLGLITSDNYGSVRAIVDPVDRRRSRNRRRKQRNDFNASSVPAGRWSLFPGYFEPLREEVALEKWCRQLLTRYGVLFRDLLTRETAAPSWTKLIPVLRRMERRGEIRGGRFVDEVGGEQFATETAVQSLRLAKDDETTDPWVVVSAADPLNLIGILSPGGRLPASHTNALVLQNGYCIAVKQSGEVRFHQEIDLETQAIMTRALHRGFRPSDEIMSQITMPRGISLNREVKLHL